MAMQMQSTTSTAAPRNNNNNNNNKRTACKEVTSEDRHKTMAANSHQAENNGAIKITGYLEKKGKKKLISTWKCYWFVLEGRLLLFYKSQADYSNLSPCRGSINMGLANGLRSFICKSQNYLGNYIFEIITHTNNRVLLRTKDRSNQELWLQALLIALGQGNGTAHPSGPMNLNRFRYSLDSLVPVGGGAEGGKLKRQNTLPWQPRNTSLARSDSLIKRLKRIGGRSTSLETVVKEQHTVNSKTKLSKNKGELTNLVDILYRKDDDDTDSTSEPQTPDSPKKDSDKECLIDDRIRKKKTVETSEVETREKSAEEYLVRNSLYDEVSKRKSNRVSETKIRETKEQLVRNSLYNEVLKNKTESVPKTKVGKIKEGAGKEQLVRNSLYEEVCIDNSEKVPEANNSDTSEEYAEIDDEEYVVLREDKKKTDENENCFATKKESESVDDDDDDIEYYCSYGEIENMKPKRESDDSHLYFYAEIPQQPTEDEPILPPRPKNKHFDDCGNSSEAASTNSTENSDSPKEKKSKFGRFFSRDKKNNGDQLYEEINKKERDKPKRSHSFWKRVMWKSKKKNTNKKSGENLYDCIKYEDIVKEMDDDLDDKDNHSDEREVRTPLGERKIIPGGHETLLPTTLKELRQKLVKRNSVNCDELQHEIGQGERTEMGDNNRTGNEVAEESTPTRTNNNIYEVIDERPGLPPRRGPKQLSPYHDIPRSNTLNPKTNPYSLPSSSTQSLAASTVEIETQLPDYGSVNKKLFHTLETVSETQVNTNTTNVSDLYSEVNKSAKTRKMTNIDTENNSISELTVRQLIEKFNLKSCINVGKINVCQMEIRREKSQSDDVILRRDKCRSCLNRDNINSTHSDTALRQHRQSDTDEINRLLNNLSNITTAPLMQPGDTTSLTFNVSGPMSDEQWMALGPIRRRRHSEPDYDVPRSHRNRNFMPPIPQRPNEPIDEAIPATRFFGPVLTNTSFPDTRDGIELASTVWSPSITPDSLEPVALENQHRTRLNLHEELSRSLGSETIQHNTTLVCIDENDGDNFKNNNILHDDINKNSTALISNCYFDSLEEQSTVF